MHERCECHECTQARYKQSIQYQLTQSVSIMPIEHDENTCSWCMKARGYKPYEGPKCQ